MTLLDLHRKTLREAPGRIEAVLADLGTVIDELRSDDQLTPAGVAERITAARAEAEKAVLEIRSEATEARKNVERLAAKALAERDSLAGERGLAHDRTWARLLRRLEAGTAAADLVEEVIAAGDTASISALRAELPEYLKSTVKREPGKSSADRVQHAAHTGQRLVNRLEHAELAHLPVAQRDALAARLELPALSEVVEARAKMAVRPSGSSRLAAAYAANDAQREVESLEAAVNG